MIHVIKIDNQHLYARQLDQLFRMRKSFYADQYQWDALRTEKDWETDPYDHDHVVYLVNLDRFGDITATFRLNPSLHPNLLGDGAPQYIATGQPPRSETVWDLSRWMVTPENRRTHDKEIAPVQQELLVALMEFCQSRGITHVSMLTEAAFVKRLRRIDWPLEELGPATPYTDGVGGVAQAILVETGPHMLASIRDMTGLHSPILFELTPDPEATPPTRLTEGHIDMTRHTHAETTDFIARETDALTTMLRREASTPNDMVRLLDAYAERLRSRTREDRHEPA